MTQTRVFFSYNFSDKDFVAKVYHELSRVSTIDIYFFDEVLHNRSWEEDIVEAIRDCDWYVLFMGSNYGDTQKKEAAIFERERKQRIQSEEEIHLVKLRLPSFNENEFALSPTGENGMIVFDENDKGETNFWLGVYELVKNYLNEIIEIGDDLPINPHLFDYEKDIIDFFIRKKHLCGNKLGCIDDISEPDIDQLFDVINVNESELRRRLGTDSRSTELEDKKEVLKSITNEIHKKLKEGCSSKWPEVVLKGNASQPNRIEDIGDFRKKDAYVLAAALSNYHNTGNSLCMMRERLFFHEAGPREKLYYPQYSVGCQNTFRVAILVSGGIAPGINAVIDGIVQRHYKYKPQGGNIQVWGLKNGFQAFQNIDSNRVYLLSDEKYIQPNQSPNIVTANHINEGGSIIGTSREESLLWHRDRIEKFKDIITKLRNNHIRILYIIGGDGSMKAAHAIANLAENQRRDDWDLSVVGIPKSMDNDILWVWQTFGFVSAVEKAREFIDNLANEVKSNPRLGIVQLFGSESGFVVSHAVLASRTGICDIALIPEVPFSMKALGRTLIKKFEEKRGQYGLIVMAETAIPTDAMDYVDYPEKMPPYLSRKYFEERIINNSEVGKELKEKIIRCYQMGSDEHYVYTNCLTETDEKEVLKGIHENGLITYINYDDIRNRRISINEKYFSNREKNLINERAYTENWKDFISMLDSVGYKHYIDIDLSKDEKEEIVRFTKLRNKSKRIQGQTDDRLRSAGLKIVSRGILKLGINFNRSFRVLTNEPRHLLRAIPPSTIDIISGNRLGTLAVDNAMAGYSDFMISQWLTEFALVPLKLVVLGRKRIPSNGIFWRSVLTKTGQPAVMV